MSSRTDERAAEVFPWMEHAIVVGALVGAVVAVGLGRANHLEPSAMVFGGLFGAAAGAAVGICLAFFLSIEVPPVPVAYPGLVGPMGGQPESPPR